jgi:hypothetical protein
VTTEILTDLGARVAIDQEDIEDVAADFLGSLDMSADDMSTDDMASEAPAEEMAEDDMASEAPSE